MNDSSQPRSLGLTLVAAISATVTVLLALRLPSALASFRQMFLGYGVTIPAPAKLVIDAPYIWWLLAVASVALFIWVAAKSQVTSIEHRRMKITLRVLITLTVLSYAFAAWAIYTPIFKLGAVV